MNMIPAGRISYFLPAITCSFPWEKNKNYDEEFQENTDDWVLSLFSDNSRVIAYRKYTHMCRLYLWVAHVLPRLPRKEYELWSKYTGAATVLDDAHERDWEASVSRDGGSALTPWEQLTENAESMRSRSTPPHPKSCISSPLVHGITQLVDQISDTMPDAERDAFLTVIRDYFHSNIYRNEHRASMPVVMELSLDQYLSFRDDDTGMWPYIIGVPHIMGAHPTEEEWNDPRRARLAWLANRHVLLVNDLYSFHKEYLQHSQNIPSLLHSVTVMVLGDGLEWQEAIDRLVNLVYAAEREYTEIRDQWIAEGASTAVREVFTGFELEMAGSLRYHLTSPRYHGRDFSGEFTSQTITCDPADERFLCR
ncbi:terpene synthase family protein [Streptomyces sp. MNU76]|uniref:terpene synthase family protein n=1 Tax=Streptomyces sp. MNU76 TaxID=2560026 RepID=UPI001E349418|nr:terpene synthase family protein [Streptomyces sp. MNU76]MCC9706036.1 terpene synthase family protein [Streptomyces sp. MNU76]